jgi:hypothetical protein
LGTTAVRDGLTLITAENKLVGQFESTGTDLSTIGSATGVFTTNNSHVEFTALIPIQGWSSSVQTSDQTDTRVVAAKAQISSGSPVANSQINYSTVIIDTHGAITTGASWKYTAPVGGVYRVSIAHSTGASNNLFGLFKNGTMESNMAFVLGSAGSNAICGSSTTLSLNAGDFIDIRPGSSNGSFTSGGGTGSSVANSNYITIERLSGPSAIAASETVAANYWLPANQLTNSTTPLNYSSKVYDTHGAVTTGASWRFTAPIGGLYHITTLTYAAGANAVYNLYKNGSLYTEIGEHLSTHVSTASASLQLLAGEYIDIRGGTAVTVTGAATFTTVAARIYIHKVGML